MEENIDLFVAIGKDWGQAKQQLEELRLVVQRRDDFILWLTEIKFKDEYSLSDLWDEYEKYEEDSDSK